MTAIRAWRSGVLGAIAMAVLSTAAKAQTPGEVHQAVERGIAYLLSQQSQAGTWRDVGKEEGVTALAILALLSCDVPSDNAKLQKSLLYLEKMTSRATYDVALQTMALAEADKNKYLPKIRDNCEWLIRSRTSRGRWSYYYSHGPRNSGDNSNTQYALLGMQAAADAGVVINKDFWEGARQYWLSAQTVDGGWSYADRQNSPYASMTAAGIASLIIAGRQMRLVREGVVEGRAVRCNGALEDHDLERACNWMGRNFSIAHDPKFNGGNWRYYYLYGLERAGRLSGRRFFGDHDWYREGVKLLLAEENNGRWGKHPIVDTSFALLFLSKGRAPVVMNKLLFGADDDWNKAPNDVHNMTAFVARHWRRKLNWQVVDIRTASVADLLQAPVLHLSGHHPPKLSPAQCKVLRQYVDEGGVLLANANCSLPGFDRGFRELCREIFPDAELQPLGADHGVWTSAFNLNELSAAWPLEGIVVGCRTGVFYSPEDLSCNWEWQDDNSIAALRLGANIISYTTGPDQLADKLLERKPSLTSKEVEIKRNYLHIAKLRHGGDWNSAPLAVRELMESLHATARIDVVPQQHDIDVTDPNLVDFPFSYMHGRKQFTLDAEEQKKLSDYLHGGGVLFADACCGSEQFDASFKELVRTLFPGRQFSMIPLDHELFTRNIGYDLRQVAFTRGLKVTREVPHLEGIELDGRYLIIYSKYDIGCALERRQHGDCKGYSHESAVKIATNVILYALKQ